MVHAYHQGLTQQPRYVFLGVDYNLYNKFPYKTWNKELGTNYSYELYKNEILEGLISVQAQRPDEQSKIYLDFEKDVMKRVLEEPFNAAYTPALNVSFLCLIFSPLPYVTVTRDLWFLFTLKYVLLIVP